MDRIVDHVLAFEGDGIIKDFVGNFSEYREKKAQDQNKKIAAPIVEAPKKVEAVKSAPQTATKKLSFKEQQELKEIEKEIPKLEKERNEILEKLNNETDYAKIAEYSKSLETISEKLQDLEMRWLELQD